MNRDDYYIHGAMTRVKRFWDGEKTSIIFRQMGIFFAMFSFFFLLRFYGRKF